MTDEAASMPQETLREIVLRLICPENPSPLTGSSEISIREQQATAFLKPSAARKLNRSNEAIDFLNRFAAQPPLLDEVAGLFLAVTEGDLDPTGLLNEHCLPSFVFEEILYSYRVVMLGASQEIMERCMRQLVRGGWWRNAEALA